LDAEQKVNRCLWRITCGDADARDHFVELQGAYMRDLGRFVEPARGTGSILIGITNGSMRGSLTGAGTCFTR
jgi:hypothetical protein